jgi:hypothetical protein
MLAILEGLNYPAGMNPRPEAADLSRVGVGISDDWRLARRVSQLFSYTNSYYHQYPLLDITNPPSEVREHFEFVCCSDVLEHVPPPVDVALEGLLSLLKPGGFAVLSVPCNSKDETSEYYPNLVSYEMTNGVLNWVDRSGSIHQDPSPEMHGGSGQTLAFRLWSRDDLIRRCQNVGFHTVYQPMTLPPIAEQNATPEHYGLIIARRS